MPAEECWLPGRLVMGKELATEVLLGTSRPLYCETPDRPWTSHFLEAARADDVPAARDLMLSIRNVADGIFARHHARGAHEVALTKAVTAMFGMARSEEHTSELQSLMRNPYAVFCLKKTTID